MSYQPTDDETSAQPLLLGIDIGGTKTAAGVVTRAGRALSFHVEPTPRDADADGLLAFVVRVAERACEGYSGQVEAVGVGCGGPMVYPDGVVSPLFIPAWLPSPLCRWTPFRAGAVH